MAWRRGGGAACRALAGPCAGHWPACGQAAGRRTAGGKETGETDRPGGATADHETAELTAHYWRAYDQRMATVRFRDVARRFPALVGQAVSLGWSANRRDTAATIGLNLVSGVCGRVRAVRHHRGAEALFAAGPTPHRVRAALPSLILVAVATAVRSGIAAAAGLGAGPAGAAGGPAGRGAAVRPDHAGGAGRVRRPGLPRPTCSGR